MEASAAALLAVMLAFLALRAVGDTKPGLRKLWAPHDDLDALAHEATDVAAGLIFRVEDMESQAQMLGRTPQS